MKRKEAIQNFEKLKEDYNKSRLMIFESSYNRDFKKEVNPNKYEILLEKAENFKIAIEEALKVTPDKKFFEIEGERLTVLRDINALKNELNINNTEKKRGWYTI